MVLETAQGKWTPQILRALLPGMCRFTCLRRQLPGISAKVLSQRLRELEAQGLLLRTVLPCVPPAVEYRLSASAPRHQIDSHKGHGQRRWARVDSSRVPR